MNEVTIQPTELVVTWTYKTLSIYYSQQSGSLG